MKKIIAMTLTVIIMLSAIVNAAAVGAIIGEPEISQILTGDGTQENPYIINNQMELDCLVQSITQKSTTVFFVPAEGVELIRESRYGMYDNIFNQFRFVCDEETVGYIECIRSGWATLPPNVSACAPAPFLWDGWHHDIPDLIVPAGYAYNGAQTITLTRNPYNYLEDETSFVVERESNLTGDGTQKSPFTINTQAEYIAMTEQLVQTGTNVYFFKYYGVWAPECMPPDPPMPYSNDEFTFSSLVFMHKDISGFVDNVNCVWNNDVYPEAPEKFAHFSVNLPENYIRHGRSYINFMSHPPTDVYSQPMPNPGENIYYVFPYEGELKGEFGHDPFVIRNDDDVEIVQDILRGWNNVYFITEPSLRTWEFPFYSHNVTLIFDPYIDIEDEYKTKQIVGSTTHSFGLMFPSPCSVLELPDGYTYNGYNKIIVFDPPVVDVVLPWQHNWINGQVVSEDNWRNWFGEYPGAYPVFMNGSKVYVSKDEERDVPKIHLSLLDGIDYGTFAAWGEIPAGVPCVHPCNAIGSLPPQEIVATFAPATEGVKLSAEISGAGADGFYFLAIPFSPEVLVMSVIFLGNVGAPGVRTATVTVTAANETDGSILATESFNLSYTLEGPTERPPWPLVRRVGSLPIICSAGSTGTDMNDVSVTSITQSDTTENGFLLIVEGPAIATDRFPSVDVKALDVQNGVVHMELRDYNTHIKNIGSTPETWRVTFEISNELLGKEIVINGVSWQPDPINRISLIPSGDHDFGTVTLPYNVPDSHIVTASIMPGGRFAAELSGENPDSFILKTDSPAVPAIMSAIRLIITPKANLTAGTHTATVTVSSEPQGISESFDVSFTVNPSPVVATIKYSPNTTTSGNVIAHLETSEKVTITNNGGRDMYKFSQNGSFTFEFTDTSGKKGSATAFVTWITSKGSSGSGGGGGGGGTPAAKTEQEEQPVQEEPVSAEEDAEPEQKKSDETITSESVPYVDVSNSWASGSIKKVTEKGLMKGYDDGSFKPDNSLTRAEFAVVVSRMTDLSPVGGNSFVDTDKHWSQGYVNAVAEKGFMNGNDNGGFEPERTLTREEMIVIICRVLNISPTDMAQYADQTDISSWAEGYVNAAYERGIVKGYGDGTFRPKNSITRAEIAAIISRLE